MNLNEHGDSGTKFKDDKLMLGSVVEFDSDTGLGHIHVESGENVLFHCAEIADGSRQVEIGSLVAFVVRRKFANWEAFAIRPR